MYHRNKFLKYKLFSVEGGEPGGGGGGTPPDPAQALKDLQAKFDDLTDQFGRVKNKNEELLTEAKNAKAAKTAAEEAAKTAAEEAMKQSGDFKSLYESSQKKLEETINELGNLRGTVAKEKISNTAMKIATEIAEGPNAELLADFLARRLTLTNDEIKVTDASGNLTVSSFDDLKKEFQTDAKYAGLIKGNQASGGGAPGGGGGGGAANKQMTRDEFNACTPSRQSEFIKSGGTVTD